MPPLSIAELAAALHGLARLIRLDREGFEYFDASPLGLLKSFWVAVALLPLYGLHIIMDLTLLDIGQVVHPLRYISVELIAYVIDWVAFPVLLLSMAPMLGVAPMLFRFLVPFNWIQLPLGLVVLPLGLLARLNVLAAGLGDFIGLLVIGGSLVITTLLARYGLLVGWGPAIGITVLGFTLSLFINAIAFVMTTG
ncbi:hypothetical protein [uncultured Rhodospira sp.]|uniref:hypothetical protein n=1 Tax=uncultured Rhodospira sp. TaxID=1936189 RepID=UPI00261B3E83|nr:hypothetical protein [uncultured Rhodospira sp.]